MNVDFEKPKDYKERECTIPAKPQMHDSVMGSDPRAEVEPKLSVRETFSGQGQRVDGKAIKVSHEAPALLNTEDDDEEQPWKNRIPGGVKWKMAPYTYRSETEQRHNLFSGPGNNIM